MSRPYRSDHRPIPGRPSDDLALDETPPLAPDGTPMRWGFNGWEPAKLRQRAGSWERVGAVLQELRRPALQELPRFERCAVASRMARAER